MVIARMRAACSSRDRVLADAVQARNTEKQAFEEGLGRERAAYAREIARREAEKANILQSHEMYMCKWVGTMTQIALDVNREANKNRLIKLLADAVKRFPEARYPSTLGTIYRSVFEPLRFMYHSHTYPNPRVIP